MKKGLQTAVCLYTEEKDILVHALNEEIKRLKKFKDEEYPTESFHRQEYYENRREIESDISEVEDLLNTIKDIKECTEKR